MTKFQSHCERWSKGCGNDLCRLASKVVLSRGKIPCDIAFVGEAPGESEDTIGKPFVGPAGRKLDAIVEEALAPFMEVQIGEDGYTEHLVGPRTLFTNLVGCIPRDPEEGGKAGAPEVEQVEQCRPRLVELLTIARPKMIVAVGSLADHYLTPGYRASIKVPGNPPVVSIKHPAFILRSNYAVQSLLEQECVVRIRTGWEDVLTEQAKQKHKG